MEPHYKLSNYPLYETLRRMSRADIDRLWKSFLTDIPARLDGLKALVSESVPWVGDFSDQSLETIDVWLGDKVESVRSEAMRLSVPGIESDMMIGSWNFADYKPSDRSLSYAFDVGIYIGECLIHRVSHARWYQPCKFKRNADYGQPMLSGFGSIPISPIAVAQGIVYQRLEERERLPLVDSCRRLVDMAEDCPLMRTAQ